jgi:hypothetical protein
MFARALFRSESKVTIEGKVHSCNRFQEKTRLANAKVYWRLWHKKQVKKRLAEFVQSTVKVENS